MRSGLCWRTRVPFHLAIRSVTSIRCVSTTRDSAQRHREVYVAYIHCRTQTHTHTHTHTHTSGSCVFQASWCQHKKKRKKPRGRHNIRTLLNIGECHSHTDAPGDAVMSGHENGGMQLESNHVLSCKLGEKKLWCYCMLWRLKGSGKGYANVYTLVKYSKPTVLYSICNWSLHSPFIYHLDKSTRARPHFQWCWEWN